MMFICMAAIEKSIPSQSKRKLGMARELNDFSRPLKIPDSPPARGSAVIEETLPFRLAPDRRISIPMMQTNSLHGPFIPKV